MKLTYLVIWSLLISSCVHSVHQVHTSDFSKVEQLNSLSKDSRKIVKVKKEQFVILGFTQQTNYINQAYDELLMKCNGPITGITTQLSASLGFFSWTNKVLIQGWCLNSDSLTKSSNKFN